MYAIVPYLVFVRGNLCQIGRSNSRLFRNSPDPGVNRHIVVSRGILMVSIEQNSTFQPLEHYLAVSLYRRIECTRTTLQSWTIDEAGTTDKSTRSFLACRSLCQFGVADIECLQISVCQGACGVGDPEYPHGNWYNRFGDSGISRR